MKIIKILLGLLVAVIIIGVVLVILLFSNLNEIVKEAIETTGSDTLQTSVTVDQVDIEIRQGRGQIMGLTIANPPDYSYNNIVTAGNITLQIDIESLGSDVQVIQEIYIQDLALRAEQKNIRETNFQALLDNVAGDSSAAATAGSTQSGEDIRLMVETLMVEESQIELHLENRDSPFIVVLPAYSQSNIGDREQGLSPEQLGRVIAQSMFLKAVESISDQLESSVRDKLENIFREKFQEEVGIDPEQLKEKVEQALDPEQLKGKVNEELNERLNEKLNEKLGEKLGTEQLNGTSTEAVDVEKLKDALKSLFDTSGETTEPSEEEGGG